MKSTFILVVLALLVLSIGAASATVVSSKTLIAGKIYNADYSDTISGADVTVTCNGNILNTISLSDGAYSVTYIQSDCESGDSLTVSATKGDLYGSETGTIHEDAFGNCEDWDLAVVNVPLVPEFGAVIGLLTILSAVGVFFVVRRD